NIDEALSGVKAGSNAVKVFGYDLDTDESLANRIAEILKSVRGVTDVFVFRSLGQPNIVVQPDRLAASRYGLNTGDVSAIVQAAICRGTCRYAFRWPDVTFRARSPTPRLAWPAKSRSLKELICRGWVSMVSYKPPIKD